MQQRPAMVAYARNLCPIVEFSVEDATRSDREYLCRVFEAAIKPGQQPSIFLIPLAIHVRTSIEALFTYLREQCPELRLS